MSDTNDIKARLVPAICTQCGAKLEVDPTHDAAVCPYCNTPFIVEKAVQNYSVQNAKIEHVDTVKVDMKGAADSLFGFLGEQMSESREARREERRERRAESREINRAFIKLFTYMMIGMFALAAIAFIVMQFRGDSGQEETGARGEAQSITETVQENASGNGTGASYEVEFAADAKP